MLNFIRRLWINRKPIPRTDEKCLRMARQRMYTTRASARKGDYTSLSGITVEQLAVIIQHQTSCEICGGKDSGKELSVDHHHGNGRFRGMLCSSCNFGIGHLNDDPELIRKAAKYLEKPILYVR